MKSYILLSVFCLQFFGSYGYPNNEEGVGAYAYQDSDGNRYGGTFNLQDGKVVKTSGELPMFDGNQPGGGNFPGYGDLPFFGGDFPFGNFFEPEEFFPVYFRNFENLLQEPLTRVVRRIPFFRRAFQSNLENQKVALNAAQKAFDLTSNQAGQEANFMSRFRPFGLSRFGADNSAIAAAAAGPGISRHMGMISPANPSMPNYDVSETYDLRSPNPGRYSVSSSSYSSSSNINGRRVDSRGSETLVDNNGQVSHYAVHS